MQTAEMKFPGVYTLSYRRTLDKKEICSSE